MNKQDSFWEQQKNDQWKTLISSLENYSEIFSQIDNLITDSYWNFRQKKGIDKDAYPEVDFQGFKDFEEHDLRAGHCEFDAQQKIQTTYIDDQETEKTTKIDIKLTITLNQWFLLDRLGMDKLFFSEDSHILVGFDELIGTIAHELAHAYQQTVNNFAWGEIRSQCASSGDKASYPELVAEHTALTSEIKDMIENSSEYQRFKEWWEAGKTNVNENEEQNSPEKKETNNQDDNDLETKSDELKSKEELEKELTDKVKVAEEKNELAKLVFAFNEASNKDLTSLVNAYQKVVKTSPLYTAAKKSFADNDIHKTTCNEGNANNNKEYLDNIYHTIKKKLQALEEDKKNKQNSHSQTNLRSEKNNAPKTNYWPLIIGGSLVVAGIIGAVVYFLWSKSNSKKK